MFSVRLHLETIKREFCSSNNNLYNRVNVDILKVIFAVGKVVFAINIYPICAAQSFLRPLYEIPIFNHIIRSLVLLYLNRSNKYSCKEGNENIKYYICLEIM
jgi:hypothetical protein